MSDRVVIPLPSKKPSVEFFPSGCTTLDLVLGGGWAQGRVINLVGERAVGKSLVAIEACANFARKYHAENIAYREVEAAFDQDFAREMGLPDGLDFNESLRTIEDVERDLHQWLETCNGPNLYVLDSLDALSSDAEMGRDVGEATYGTEKAKALSTLFRKLTGELHQKECTLFIISQVREKIGVMFGEKKYRSGGKALDFYASQIIWLIETGKIERTVSGIKRKVGTEVKVQCKKNKCGIAYRDASFSIVFGFGTDDELSMLDWLKDVKGEKHLDKSLGEYTKLITQAREAQNYDQIDTIHATLKKATIGRWNEIEDALRPSVSKYTR